MTVRAPADMRPAGEDRPRRRGRPGHDLAAVIAAGVRVFTERGYHAATMDDVAAELGIAKSSLYHHVSRKEEILQQALDRALCALEAVFDDAEGSAADPARALEMVVRGAVDALIAELPSVTLLLRVRGNSGVERTALQRRRALDTRLATLVIRAQSDGAVRADLDPHVVARLVFGTVNSLTEWYRPAHDAGGGMPVGAYSDAPATNAAAGAHGDTAAADIGHGSGALADTVCAMMFGGLRPRP